MNTVNNPPQPTARRDRRLWAAAVVAILLLALVAYVAADRGATPTPTTTTGESSTDRDHVVAADRAEDPVEDEDPWTWDLDLTDSDGKDSPAGKGSFNPVGKPGKNPCAGHDGSKGAVQVTPDPVLLKANDLTGELHLRNCGTASVSWTALTKPTVSLAKAAGTLAAGEVRTVGFTIDKSGWDPGAIDFKIKVSEPGHSQYVDVHAFRSADYTDYVATNDLTAGPQAGGCALQCIVRAKLSTGYSSTAVGLDVATKVPAKVRVYLSTHAPVLNGDGDPWFPGRFPKRISPAGITTWTTTLSGLAAHTTYHIIVQATDDNGHTAYQAGKFTTVTPVPVPPTFGGNDPAPGCAAQCLTKTTLTPGDGVGPAQLSVRSHTPATFELLMSTQEPVQQGGHPSFVHPTITKSSGHTLRTAWDLAVAGLSPGTTYHGIVVATDANGKKAFATGSLTTPGVDVEIRIHEVHLTKDGDAGRYNRGELSFAWGVGDDVVGTLGEKKRHAPATVTFGGHDRYVAHDVKGTLPTVRVAAFERDNDVIHELCTLSSAVPQEHGSSGRCDLKWNAVAAPALKVQDVPDGNHCGLAGPEATCVYLGTEDHGDDYPLIWTVITYRVLE